jgi:putative membrane protein
MSARKVIVAVLAAAYAVLWVGGLMTYQYAGAPPEQARWAAPAFLMLAALLACGFSPAREGPVLAAAGLLGFAAEVVGVHTGLPFGSYRYTDALGLRLLGVPVAMAGAWLVLFAYVRQVFADQGLPRWTGAVLAAAWMMLIDLLIDPLASDSLGYWEWAEPGAYYGVPAGNFAGWLAVSFALFILLPPPRGAAAGVRWVGASVVGFFVALAVGRGLAGPAAIGLALGLLHALAEVGRRRRRRAAA